MASKRRLIWVDGYEANVPQRLGSGQVAWELLKQLQKHDQHNFYKILLPSTPLSDLPAETDHFKYQILPIGKFWTRVVLPLYSWLTLDKPDVFFSPNHYLPLFLPGRIKKVVTIFDLAFLYFPEMFLKKDLWKLRNWTRESVRQAEHIITISQTTKKDLIKFYKLDERKISVLYPGYNSEVYKPIKDYNLIDRIRAKYGLSKNYIIFIGTLQPRKNLVRLIEAFKLLIHEDNVREDLELVIVGKSAGEGREGWMFEQILTAPQRMGIKKRVKFLGYVPTEELGIILAGAQLFVQPSLYEGFGIPVVDAMASGVPVVVSNCSSLPEVIGDAGLTFDPLDPREMSQVMYRVLKDKVLRKRLIGLGLKRVKKFSWEKMGQGLIKILEEV